MAGFDKHIDIKNLDLDGIQKNVARLRNSSGRKMKRLDVPVTSETPSIQGVWQPTVPFQSIEVELEHVYAGQGKDQST